MDESNETSSVPDLLAKREKSKFCAKCGQGMPMEAQACPTCGHPCSLPPSDAARHSNDISKKKFGTAVALCGVFGILGIHHFYLGNILHGIADFLLCVVAITCFVSNDPSLVPIGLLLLLIDFGHTFWVMVRLFTGKTRDGLGKLVVYPGQI
ncbi:TM2 domain-containing protein [Thalassospira sp. TSL5-1]|uniref:TM2 domain-containing protein n=1 Tax=Thalassospira sp. TSL5-1 TaxID=1544451 RepID=UPI000AAC38ED|nr:TM2 domain-containing protein [Thalassospira sp. TSL5-1]